MKVQYLLLQLSLKFVEPIFLNRVLETLTQVDLGTRTHVGYVRVSKTLTRNSVRVPLIEVSPVIPVKVHFGLLQPKIRVGGKTNST